MRARVVITLAVPVLFAAVFARLGVWQLSRLRERRAWNLVLMERLGSGAVPIAALGADSVAGHYRKVTAEGVYDYSREIVWAARARQGSPGVNLLTPLRVGGSDAVIIVDRGWVYSANAKSVERARWRERDSARVAGYVETWSQPCDDVERATCADSADRVIRKLNLGVARSLTGLTLAPFVLMQTSDSALRADSVPVRVGFPALDEGPHRNYAIQWFAFAFIALAGGALFVRLRYYQSDG